MRFIFYFKTIKMNRITPDNIINLLPNEIFVFGDNEAHIHGAGAAKTAMKWGAKRGLGGLQGQTYGIPTKGAWLKILNLTKIHKHILSFLEVAKANPQLIFLVTEIGCGLAGYKPKDIAPLFAQAIDIPNIHLPARFWHKLIKYEETTSDNGGTLQDTGK